MHAYHHECALWTSKGQRFGPAIRTAQHEKRRRAVRKCTQLPGHFGRRTVQDDGRTERLQPRDAIRLYAYVKRVGVRVKRNESARNESGCARQQKRGYAQLV